MEAPGGQKVCFALKTGLVRPVRPHVLLLWEMFAAVVVNLALVTVTVPRKARPGTPRTQEHKAKGVDDGAQENVSASSSGSEVLLAKVMVWTSVRCRKQHEDSARASSSAL